MQKRNRRLQTLKHGNHDQSKHNRWPAGYQAQTYEPVGRRGGSSDVVEPNSNVANRISSLQQRARSNILASSNNQPGAYTPYNKKFYPSPQQREMLMRITDVATEARVNTDNFYSKLSVLMSNRLDMYLRDSASGKWSSINEFIADKRIKIGKSSYNRHPELQSLFLSNAIDEFFAMRPRSFLFMGKNVSQSEWESLDFDHAGYINSLNTSSMVKEYMLNTVAVWRNAEQHSKEMYEFGLRATTEIQALRETFSAAGIWGQVKAVDKEHEAMLKKSIEGVTNDTTFAKRDEFISAYVEYTATFNTHRKMQEERVRLVSKIGKNQDIELYDPRHSQAQQEIIEDTKRLKDIESAMAKNMSDLKAASSVFDGLLNEWLDENENAQQRWKYNKQRQEQLKIDLEDVLAKNGRNSLSFFQNVFYALSRKRNGLDAKVAPMISYSNPEVASTLNNISPKEFQELADVMYEILPDYLGVSEEDLPNSTELNVVKSKDSRAYINGFSPNDLQYATDPSSRKRTFAKLKMQMGITDINLVSYF